MHNAATARTLRTMVQSLGLILLLALCATTAHAQKKNKNQMGTDTLLVTLDEIKNANEGDRVNIVDLSRYNTPDYTLIKAIPKKLFEINILDTLNLSFNQIAELPGDVVKLKELKCLDLRYNIMDDLPREIVKMKKLQSLYIEGNNIDDDKIIFIRTRRPDLYIDILDNTSPRGDYLW